MNTSQESSELPNAAQTLSSLAEVDIETAELFLEQTLIHFPSDASLTRRSIVDKMSAMAKEYSISMHDLFLASGRSIGAADAVGVSFKGLLEAIAVLGTVGDMRGSHAGHVLRNLLLRFQERGYVCRNGRFALASPSKEEEVAPDRPPRLARIQDHPYDSQSFCYRRSREESFRGQCVRRW